MRTASKIAFWIAIFALLLFAVVISLPDYHPGNYPGDWQSYVGCTYDFKSGVQCLHFAGSDIVQHILEAGMIFSLGSLLSWPLVFFNPPFLIVVVIGLSVMIIDILAVIHVISLVKNRFRKTAAIVPESNTREFKIAKMLIIILLFATVVRVAVWYSLNPLELERQVTYYRPLTVSATAGNAPLTVQITGPMELLSLKDNVYHPREWSALNPQPAPLSYSGCGFYVSWLEYDAKGTVNSIGPDPRENGCAALLSYTFKKPGRYGVTAFIYDPRYGGEETWRSKRMEVNVK